ncbi:hypothetical protein SAMN05421783_102122 [Thiocapsa roseopersicina]|uniref:Uncharacterized protein n=1 Tax=Thiocapsa roseopersicina TaxID=1058 RepID=A0A1H2RPI6_THIRO|nr:hypothetical protein SAMN05421783_102122 [Thiocapsa roseopersicina]
MNHLDKRQVCYVVTTQARMTFSLALVQQAWKNRENKSEAPIPEAPAFGKA